VGSRLPLAPLARLRLACDWTCGQLEGRRDPTPARPADANVGRHPTPPRTRPTILALLALAAALGCRQQKMADQPRYDPFESSAFFSDGQSARPRVDGTVARGELAEDPVFATGKESGRPAERLPVPLDAALLARGRERYDVFCAPCHDRVGTGQGMIVQRGYRRPPSFHEDRLRAAPPGHFFDVVTNGFGAMPAYAAQVPLGDRWAIAAYVRALQRSQHATLADVPPAERARLEQGARR
jgi:mono/diheme cytochrome c family protein